MTQSIQTLEAEWLAKMTEMRAAIASLKLANVSPELRYGTDFELDDGDFAHSPGSDHLWHIISDVSEDTESDVLDGSSVQPLEPSAGPRYDGAWLEAQCSLVAIRNSGLDSEALFDQLIAILSSDSDG
jgi:antiviral helicase SLH1